MTQHSPAETLITRIREGSAPEPVRAAAAKGALPFPRTVLARLYLLLADDPTEEIRNQARASLAEMPDDAVTEILSDPDCDPALLAHFAPAAAKNEGLAERVAFHAATPDAALAVLAESGNAAVIDLVLTNQQRLLSSPGVLDRLMANRTLRAEQRGRLLEMLDEVSKRSDSADGADGDVPDGEIDLEEQARLLDVDIDVGELYAASEILGGEEFEHHEVEEVRSAYRKILTLNTAQRAILAIKGGREERMILVRDSNKIVALSVLKNGRITDGEVEQIAGMRNVSQDILRGVGANREWIKGYTVINALVRNPRTPPGVSTNFISRLNNHDLKMLAKDKNVPELIRRMAKKTIDLRNQRMKTTFRKK